MSPGKYRGRSAGFCSEFPHGALTAATICGVLLLGLCSLSPAFSADPATNAASPSPSDGATAASNQSADNAAIVFTVATNKAKYALEEPISIKAIFVNNGSVSAAIVWPAGADVKRLFRYRIVDINTDDEWLGEPVDDRSLVRDERRTMAPGDCLERTDSALRFKEKGGQWIPSLPAGDYQITAKYDAMRTANPQNAILLTLQSAPARFSIKAD